MGKVGHAAVAVGRGHRHEDRAVLGDAGLQAVGVGEGEDFDFTSIGQISELCGGDGAGGHGGTDNLTDSHLFGECLNEDFQGREPARNHARIDRRPEQVIIRA